MAQSSPSVLLLASELPPGPGGIGTHAHQVALHLERLGWTVHVAAPQDYASDREISDWSARQRFRVHRLRRPRVALAGAVARLWRVRRVVAAVRPDLIVASGLVMVWLAALFAGGRPWVAIAHGYDVTCRGWRGVLGRWAFRRATTVVAVSRFTGELVRASGIGPRRLAVILNGADDAMFRPLAPAEREVFLRRHGALVEERRWLVTLGRVCDRKGQDLVVRALAALVEEFPDLHYALIGLEDPSLDLGTLAADLGIGERVHRLGRLDTADVLGFFDLADLFVMPSRRSRDGDVEGFGIAAVEAALCRTAAVVTSGSGLAEAVDDGDTGWVIPPDDLAALTACLWRCLADPEGTRAMGARAARVARAEKTWGQRVAEYDALLRQLLPPGPAH